VKQGPLECFYKPLSYDVLNRSLTEGHCPTETPVTVALFHTNVI